MRSLAGNSNLLVSTSEGGKDGGCYEVWNNKGEIIEQVKGKWLFAIRNSDGNICAISQGDSKLTDVVLLKNGIEINREKLLNCDLIAYATNN